MGCNCLQVDGDPSLLGKLDGIPDQIDQHLAQASRISLDHRRYIRFDPNDQLQPLLLGLAGEQVLDLPDHRPGVHGTGLQNQLSGLDPGEIEDVIDDPQQGTSTITDSVEIALLSLIQIGVQQQFGHADHCIHRGPDLMAHSRHKMVLGLSSRLDYRHRFQQAPFVPLLARDVESGAAVPGRCFLRSAWPVPTGL